MTRREAFNKFYEISQRDLGLTDEEKLAFSYSVWVIMSTMNAVEQTPWAETLEESILQIPAFRQSQTKKVPEGTLVINKKGLDNLN